ncbi:MAG TPA: DUF427 domain-containing protein, partial [Solirubrobacteraceae bacterium]|nr:DUF427 domain-containing protein [Solirubrobacteraceae bacterium]
WQQGPLAPGAIGHFLIPEPLPERILFAEPLRRRMRVKFGDQWIADSQDVVLLHEPGRYPVAYFRAEDIVPGTLQPSTHTTTHRDLGSTTWYTVNAGEQSTDRAAWQHTDGRGHLKWPQCGRLKWPHLRPTGGRLFEAHRARAEGGGRDAFTHGAVRADQEGPRS